LERFGNLTGFGNLIGFGKSAGFGKWKILRVLKGF
jgi:hypothetical protein